MSEYIAGRYQVIKLIGRGGMADVYLALDTILNREVAIKVLKSEMASDPVALERFRREANATTYLSHPNIVDVYDVGDDGDKHFIVMEYVNGHTLKQLIKRRGAIPYKEAVWLMKQLSGALMEAHRHQIIHRDVKSQNVLIKNDGTVKVADFGIALANGEVDITSKDSVLGSVHYLAPELTKGVQATMQSDIYSLGIVFFELLTGDVPYKGENAIQIALQHVKGDIPSVRSFDPNIPQSVENIIIKSTAKSLENRYANIALMLRDLNDCLKEEHLNDPPLVLDAEKEDKTKASFHISDTAEKKEKKKKENRFEEGVSFVIITSLTVIAILLLVSILYLSGIIGGNSAKTTVPSLKNLTIVEASDLLDENQLSIDYSSIERVMTDDIEAGKIISSNPAEGSEVDKGEKVRITVSEGIYSVMEDYKGYDINEVREKLSKTNLFVQSRPVASDLDPGTIISQEGLLPGDKYNGNISNELILYYSEFPTILIPHDILGKNIEEVKNWFIDQGMEVEVHIEDVSYFSEDERNRYPAGSVVRSLPNPGSSYIQEGESIIHLYTY
ncbi:MAG: Stk1 family PASTA domain-containing Ser/Thr kinase [Erysipelotrichaceae bacterium]|nr:Stk1 family PASTA domain-containing Ser/Thr kinase [Erysipelotrichaceae bacterium]